VSASTTATSAICQSGLYNGSSLLVVLPSCSFHFLYPSAVTSVPVPLKVFLRTDRVYTRSSQTVGRRREVRCRYFGRGASSFYEGHIYLGRNMVKQSHNAPMDAQRERIYSSYSFMTSALHGVSGQNHAPAAPYPGEWAPGTHCTGDWVGPRASLDTEVTGKILLPLPGIEYLSPGTPVRTQTLY
jgi:hypothetical protein